jgi:hypothetical protein
LNLLEARVALRPRAMSDVIDLAGPFCIVNRRLMVPLAVLVAAVGGLLSGFCRLKLGWSWSSVWWVVAGYLWLSNGVYTQAAGELLFRRAQEVRLLAVLGRFARHFFTYLVARTVHLLVLALCAAVFVPLPIFAARLFFVSEAVLLESGSAFGSLARSSRLVLFRSLSCLGLALASLCAPFLFAMAADLIGNALVGMVFQMGEPVGSLFSDGGSAYAVAGALLSAPFVASASFLGYIDMRTRKEGWDIQLRFMALADAEAKNRRIAS